MSKQPLERAQPSLASVAAGVHAQRCEASAERLIGALAPTDRMERLRRQRQGQRLDTHRLEPGGAPRQTLADAGYRSEEVFEVLAGRTELVVAIGREGKSHRPINEASLPLTAAMVAKMKTQEARDTYRRCKWLAEPPNGWIKNVLGFCQFSMRGLHRVQAEWKLVCMALNLRRMATMQAA